MEWIGIGDGARLGAVLATLEGASVAGAQTQFFGPGSSPRSALVADLTTTELNNLNLANGTTSLSFGTLGTATISGADIQTNQIEAAGGSPAFTITFSDLLNGFGADFSQAQGTVTLTFFNGATNVGSVSGVFPNAGVQFLGATDLTFNSVRVSASTTGTFRTDNLVVGVSAVPEPGTIALLGIGLAGTALVGRRRGGAVRPRG